MAGRGLRAALLVALLAGLVTFAAFPPVGVWPLAIAGPAVLIIAVRGRRLRAAFVVGVSFGVGLYAPLLSWLVNLGVVPYLALAVLEALIAGGVGVALALACRVRWWPLAVAAVWVGAEAARDRVPFGGFPWGRLAFSQADAPTLRWAAVGGAPLVSFVVALAAGLLAWAILERRLRSALAGLAAVGAVAAGVVLPAGARADRSLAVALVQGNVPRSTDLLAQERKLTVLRNHVAATHALAARVRAGTVPAPALVIWPENATDLDPAVNPVVSDLIAGAVADVDRPVLVGAVLDAPGNHVYNAGQLWRPGVGPVQTYVKRHLVPFGEYIPFRSLLTPIVPQIALVPTDFAPGQQPTVFRVGGARLGDVICYEIAFDGIVRSTVNAGADLLVEQTNDASFTRDGQLGETQQQLAMARLRAVEHDRSVLVASTSGVSAVLTPDGSVVASTPTFVQRELVHSVPLVTARTLADRVGDGPEDAISALALAALYAGGWRSRPSTHLRRAGPGPSLPDTRRRVHSSAQLVDGTGCYATVNAEQHQS